ncbi:hypothetical protein BTE77_06560 [Ensifer adhaerens]|nr:hypothetical protein BTE77_06560 [Ensifer adhaerens]
MGKYLAAITLLLLVALQVKTISQVSEMQDQIWDLRHTAACLELGYQVEHKVNVGPEEFNRVCLIDGKPWVSWRRG